MPQRPLTENHVAKQLRKYLRSEKIPHQTFNTAISIHWPNIKNFPPLTFEFGSIPGQIHVWNKLPMYISQVHKFKSTTTTKLFSQLLEKNIIGKHQLPL